MDLKEVYICIDSFFLYSFFSFLIFFSLKWQLCHCIYRNKSLWPIYIQISFLKIFIYVIKKYTCAFYIEFCDNNVLMSFLWILKCCISLWLLLFVVSSVCVSMGVCVHMCMMGVHVGKKYVCCQCYMYFGNMSRDNIYVCGRICMEIMHASAYTDMCVRKTVCVCVCLCTWEREFLCEWKLLIWVKPLENWEVNFMAYVLNLQV